MSSTSRTAHLNATSVKLPTSWRDECSLVASFQSHWLQCVEAMRNHQTDPNQYWSGRHKQEMALASLWQNWESLEHHLALMDQVGAAQNSTAEELERGLWNCIIWNQILEQFLDWAIAHVEAATLTKSSTSSDNVLNYRTQSFLEYMLDCGVKALWHLLSFCEKLLTQTRLVRETFLLQEIHCPLLRLPRSCQLVPSTGYCRLHKRLVFYLYQLCICVTSSSTSLDCTVNSDPTDKVATSSTSSEYEENHRIYPLLDIALQLLRPHASTASGNNDQTPIVKNYFLGPLIAGLHDEDADLALWSREALMLLLNLTPRLDSLSHFIAKESDLCPVLATGLSALYSELPRELPLYEWAEDWCQLQPKEWMNYPTLMNFLTSLEFCNYAIKVSQEEISQQILDLTYSGFLVSVVAPALHQTSLQEVIACTAYLELILRRLREPRFLAVFLRFILTEEFDGTSILTTLIRRINTNSDLCLLTLSLFRTMLWLHSEDVMFWLVFRFCEAPENVSPSVYLQSPESIWLLKSCFQSSAKSYASLANSCTAFSKSSQARKCHKPALSLASPSKNGERPIKSVVCHENDPFEKGELNHQRIADISHRNEEIRKAWYTEWSYEYEEYFPKIPCEESEKEDKSSMLTSENDMEDSLSIHESEEREEIESYPCADSYQEDELALFAPVNCSIPLSSIYRINYFLEEEDDEDCLTIGENRRSEPLSTVSTDLVATTPIQHEISTHNTSIQCQMDDELDHLTTDNENFLSILSNSQLGLLSRLKATPAVEEAINLVWEGVMDPEEEHVLFSSYKKRLDAEIAANVFSSNRNAATSLLWILSPLRSPFIVALLNKLKAMPHNTVFVNLIVTDLLHELACYPHFIIHLPLLLFNSSPSLSSISKDTYAYDKSLSLFTVLQDLGARLQAYGQNVSRFSEYLLMARRYLDSRTKDLATSMNSILINSQQSGDKNTNDVESSTGTIGSAESAPNIPSTKEGDKRYVKLFDSVRSVTFGSRLKQFFQMLPSSVTSSPTAETQVSSPSKLFRPMSSSWTQIGGDYRFCIASEDLKVSSSQERALSRSHESLNVMHRSSPFSLQLHNDCMDMDRCAYESQRIRNYAYATLVYHEFCLELEALCHFHAEMLFDDASL